MDLCQLVHNTSIATSLAYGYSALVGLLSLYRVPFQTDASSKLSMGTVHVNRQRSYT